MKMLKINSEDGKSFYRLFFDEEIEYVNPIQYFKNRSLTSSFYLIKDQTSHILKDIPQEILNKIILKKALEFWDQRFCEINNEFLDSDLINLLNTNKKKDQLRILKGKSLTPNGLAKLLFIAFSEFGYTFSRYTSEKLPNNIEKEQLPIVFELSEDENKVTIIGETILKEGQLKNIIYHRKNLVANFLDKGSEWHCFYLTFKALAGKESWNNGKPHYHYLSDKFGVSRDDVIKGINNGAVPSTPVHIEIKGYRNNVF